MFLLVFTVNVYIHLNIDTTYKYVCCTNRYTYTHAYIHTYTFVYVHIHRHTYVFQLTTFFLNKFIYVIYLFLAVLGLCCCPRAFSSCSERGLLFVAVHRLHIAVASLVVDHGL